MNKIIKIFIRIMFAVYVLALFYLLFWKGVWTRHSRMSEMEYYGSFWETVKSFTNLIPFRTIRNYAEQMDDFSFRDFAFENLAGNILLFVPYGVFSPYFWQKQRKFPVFFLTALLLICCIEVTQVLTFLGSCDIDDLILNLIGCCAGFLFWLAFRPIIKKLNI